MMIITQKSSKRRRFSAEFKADAVGIVVDLGKTVAEVARSLDINEGTLGHWVMKYRQYNPEQSPPLDTPERVQWERDKKRLRELELEVDFLKKPQRTLRNIPTEREVHIEAYSGGVSEM